MTTAVSGRIECSSYQNRTNIVSIYSAYPLRLIQQQPWQAFAHVTVVGFGGGLVQGDAINFSISLKRNSTLWYELISIF